jgi:regulator of protease activity HflC (stomatin/prohibitin superfamily)
MNRHLFVLRVTVRDGERAILTRNGRFERVLEPGRHTVFDPLRETAVETFSVVRAEFPAERYAVLKTARPDVAEALFEAVETGADEVAIVSLDGRPTHLLAPWQTRVFWKVATRVEAERIDVTTDRKVAPRHLAMVARERNAYLAEHVVENHEAGLLYLEGRLVERLAPGRHAFWTVGRKIEVNTAKLMEDNPLLLRLKELESLERLVEKVGKIDLHAGDNEGLDALLTRLVRLKAPQPA